MAVRRRWIAGGGALAALAAGVVTIRTATARWHRQTAEMVRGMVDTPAKAGRNRDEAGAGRLPDPVRRYLEASLPPSPAAIRTARLESFGTFRQLTADTGAALESGWFGFTAHQTFTLEPPAFVWAATMQVRPFVKVYVRDTYLEGRGSMQGAALGLVPVVDAASHPDLNTGALMRYLAESPWLPVALLPGPRLTWEPVDDTHARATLVDGATVASVVFEFNPGGDIVGVSGRRPRATERGYEPTEWIGRFWRHENRGGMRVPTRGEVGWVLDGTLQPYWRGEMTRAEYD